MINDRQITISAGASRKAVNWQPQTLKISELYEKLRTPARSPETLADYLALKKPDQDNLKDVGGFVAGILHGLRRKGNAVAGRDVLVLDMDNIPAGGTPDLLRRIEGLGCSYCVYSTRKHHAGAPRLRILLPVDRTVTADEYEPCTRRMAAIIGIEFADPTTFEASRLMYWPSICTDGEYVYTYADKPLLSADGLLATYTDWRDINEWPQVPGAVLSPQRLAAKQGDPLAKGGVVGAFCRVYDIYRAMDELLPGIYEPVDGMPNRYTYTGGSTTGGAVTYDNGKFLYSHHSTDPCCNKLVNAFDLVRLHKFDDLDDEVVDGSRGNRLPSYTAMNLFALADPHVSALMDRERFDEAMKDFDGVTPTNEAAPENWMNKLAKTSTGTYEKTYKNLGIMLERDPSLRDRFKHDLFADRIIGQMPMPWGQRKNGQGEFAWGDADDAGLKIHVERLLGFRAPEIIDTALTELLAKNSFNPVTDYLDSLAWDGIQRLDTLFIDYLGAEDSPYTRAVTRKAFVAAIARAMTPGVKFDTMTIITGSQGIGKSTLLYKMSKGWFNDNIKTFEGKEASELVQGVWIVEIGELQAFDRSDVNRIKQFLSMREDVYRKAYGRRVEWHPRRCVFFGTGNENEYLVDNTGNRRFWPIDAGKQPATKNVFKDLDDNINQLWAEAVIRWRLGEPLYLEGELAEVAQNIQEQHRDTSAREGAVIRFLEKKVPADWSSWPIDRRRTFWGGGVVGEQELVERDRVSAVEVWVEAFGGDMKTITRAQKKELSYAIKSASKWTEKVIWHTDYGPQRGFVKE